VKNNFPLNTIYLYFTKYCNLNCRHCWIDPVYQKTETESERPKDVDLKYIFKALKEAKELGLKSVKITGGEPFIRGDIIDLLKWLKRNNLKITIETNGTLIEEKEAKAIKEANVSHIAVALDGPDKETHERLRGVSGSFEKAIEGIKLIRKNNLEIRIQVICCLWRGNIDKIKKMINFAQELGANSIKFNPVQHIARADKMEKKGDLLTIGEILKVHKKIQKFQDKKFRIIFDIPPAFKPLKNLPQDINTCGIKTLLGILGDGTISICGIGQTVKDLVMGNIRNTKIRDVWENNKILKMIREDIPEKLEGVCGICILKKLCLGKCRAEAYWTGGSLLAPLSFCQQAYE